MEISTDVDFEIETRIKNELTECLAKINDGRKLITYELKRKYLLEKELYKICSHTFTRDPSAMSDDLYKWQCTKCNLYQGGH